MYIGVKRFIQAYKKPFDRIEKATKKAKSILKDRGEKITKKDVDKEVSIIIAQWDAKAEMGRKAHLYINNRELKAKKNVTISEYQRYDGDYDGELDTSTNTLQRGQIYLEKKIVSNHHKLIGYADRVEVDKKGYINIEDYKSWDVIYRNSSFVTETGFRVSPTFFYEPISHLQDTNLTEATLQASIYMYILWTYNKKLKPGKIFIRHVKLNDAGDIINEDMVEVAYLRDEVRAMLKNKKKILG